MILVMPYAACRLGDEPNKLVNPTNIAIVVRSSPSQLKFESTQFFSLYHQAMTPIPRKAKEM
jgi:hypothetical protein